MENEESFTPRIGSRVPHEWPNQGNRSGESARLTGGSWTASYEPTESGVSRSSYSARWTSSMGDDGRLGKRHKRTPESYANTSLPRARWLLAAEG